jgi:hypothetical protein
LIADMFEPFGASSKIVNGEGGDKAVVAKENT